MNKQHLFSLIVFSLIVSAAFGQRKYSNEFLSLGVGARGQAMSLAQSASVDDVTAAYYNPAGLTRIQAPFQISAMHAEWFAGIAAYDYLAFAKPLDAEKKSALALSVIRFGIDNIPNTINLVEPDGSINYDNVTEFSAADYGIFGSYARQVSLGEKLLSIGGSAKVVRRVIGDFGGSWGFGIDVGVQYQSGNFQLGLMGRDLTTTFNAWSFSLDERTKEVFTSTGNDIPESSLEVTNPTFILGGAWGKALSSKLDFVVEADAYFTTDGQRNVLVSSEQINIDPYLGTEFVYNKFLFLRGGIGRFQEAFDGVGDEEKSWFFQPTMEWA